MTDFLVRNEQGTYDIVEVKSKTSIRKKTKKAEIYEDLQADAWLQHVVVQQVLKELYSNKISIAYLDKTYQKSWDIAPQDIVIIDDVSQDIMQQETVLQTIKTIKRNIQLDKDQFQSIYPYAWEYPLLYFGQKPELWSILTIPRITSSKKKLLELYDQWKRMITDLDHDDIELLSWGKADSAFVRFIQLFHAGKTLDTTAITQQLQSLTYPLYFYDYETTTTPIPLFEWTSPRQQVVVQYSLHKIDKDGTVTHHEWLLNHKETSNKRIIDKLIADLTQTKTWTYIVWYKWFENTRNTETWVLYPEHAAAFEHINNNTFDLMDIFKDMLYFDPAFGWSCSIKKVLPVLTDISYDWLDIGNGWAAADALQSLAKKDLTPDTVTKIRHDLLRYCRQDTRAMVAIWQKVCEEIGYDIPELKGEVG